MSFVLITGATYGKFYDNMKADVKNNAAYIAAAVNMLGTDYLHEINKSDDTSRITLISSDGTVLYDNMEDISAMDNHLNRPEVLSALKKGIGEAVRLSDTMDKQTFYYAVKLDNGTIIRLSKTMSSVYYEVGSLVPYMLVIAVVVFTLAMLIAKRQTKKIVVPINGLDLENPLSNDIYDELSPLLVRIEKQNKQIERQMRELKEKQEEFFAITKNMSEGLIILDNNAHILSINRSALEMLGIGNKDYHSKHILTINRSLPLQTAVEKSIKGASCQEILPVGKYQYQIIANPVFIDNNLKGVVLLIIDITEKYEAEQMRREFSANVSHELKTPLTSISGYAEIMKNGLVKAEDMYKFAEKIYNEASRLINLIDDIIKLSSLDENSMKRPVDQVDLLALSKDVVSRLTNKAEEKNIKLSVTGERAVITGTKQILEEMIFNLCDNAIKYNRDGGSVDVSVLYRGKNIVLTVSDTGIGIPKEHQGRVFERFYRVDKSHSKSTGGTGLGLSIVKHGAIYHNAAIELESQVGKGTTIRIIF